NVQLGAGAIVLPGVEICSNIIVGAGAIVTKNLEEPGVYVGQPARKIKDV
ncbi:TPA: N-acetyltransferase, partial [Escherichia coli]|nr:N-acetyltransferase [Escherichia coli]HCN8707653.1 N-acetyltransferase [Escherichia coli]